MFVLMLQRCSQNRLNLLYFWNNNLYFWDKIHFLKIDTDSSPIFAAWYRN